MKDETLKLMNAFEQCESEDDVAKLPNMKQFLINCYAKLDFSAEEIAAMMKEMT